MTSPFSEAYESSSDVGAAQKGEKALTVLGFFLHV